MASATWLACPDVKASAHLVIGRECGIFQLLSFDLQAWHAGKSSYAGRKMLNRYSIGIEFDNLGRLQQLSGIFRAECGRRVDAGEVYSDTTGGKLTYWHRYPERQKAVLEMVCGLLARYYPVHYNLVLIRGPSMR